MANVICSACGKKISELAVACPYCREPREVEKSKVAGAGWYPDKKRPGELRRWDGSVWVDEWKPIGQSPLSPGGLLGYAILVAVATGVVGGVLIDGNDTAGFGVVAWVVGGSIASLMSTVATVAMGVAMGLRVAKERGHN